VLRQPFQRAARMQQQPGAKAALFGLQAAFRAQGKLDAADKAEREFRAAWKNADVALTSSAIF
jgi:hypothetical protein